MVFRQILPLDDEEDDIMQKSETTRNTLKLTVCVFPQLKMYHQISHDFTKV